MRRLSLREELSLLRTKTAADFLRAYLSGLQKHQVLFRPRIAWECAGVSGMDGPRRPMSSLRCAHEVLVAALRLSREPPEVLRKLWGIQD